jgi:CheY-like chemotaxis protein
MPEMNGITAAKMIHRLNESIPVVAVTAIFPDISIKHEIETEFLAYVAKPYRPSEILSVIQSQFQHV